MSPEKAVAGLIKVRVWDRDRARVGARIRVGVRTRVNYP